MSGVLRGFLPAAYTNVRLDKNPCAALLIKKIAHFRRGDSKTTLEGDYVEGQTKGGCIEISS